VQTYNGEGTDPQGMLDPNSAYYYSCQTPDGLYDVLSKGSQLPGLGPYVAANAIQLENGPGSLPVCG
jgi:hypothetical protein